MKAKQLISCLLCVVLLLSCLPTNALAAPGETAALVEMVTDISAYRTASKTAPSKTGYVFGGWYTDEACTKPIATTVSSGAAYAKYVPEAVLTVKAQLTEGTTAQSEKTDLRLITTVDNLYYSAIGFSMSVNGSTRESESRTVYRALTAKDSGERIDLLPTAFSAASTYFHTCIITNLPNAKFDDVIHVEPYWVTLDGTRVVGTARDVSVSSGIAVPTCEHEKCATCGGCLVENCDCTIEGCCTPCTCTPVPSCEHPHCRLCGGCQEANCDHTDDCCAVTCPGEGNHDRDVAFTPPNVYRYWTPEGYDHLENGFDLSEEKLGYMDGERKYLCSMGLAYVPNKTGDGGRLWSSFVSGDTNERVGNYIAVVTSGDNGETWSEMSVVIEHPNENVVCCDGPLWTDPDGRLWVFWTQSYCPVVWRGYDYVLDGHNLNPDGTLHSDSLTGVWCMYSDNAYEAEPTFSEPVRLCDGMTSNKPMVATIEGKETWLINPWICSWIALDDPATSLTQGPTLYTFTLDENGVPKAEYYSKIMKEPYADYSTFRNYCEPMMVQTSDGGLMMLVRTDRGIEVTRTTDPLTSAPYTGGWTELDYLRNGEAIVSRTASRVNLTKLDDGRLLLVYHDTLTAGRINMTIALSEDDGKTWPYKLLLDERAVTYPDITIAPDGTIYIQYDFERYGLQHLYLTRFTVEDILAGAFVSDVAARNLLINDNDYNKPAPYQTVGAVMEETAGAWLGANATSDGYKKLGTAAAEGVISYENGTAIVPSAGVENPTGLAYLTTGTSYINSGTTMENGAVAFELYVTDRTTFNQKWGVVSIGDNNSWVGSGMGNLLTWNMSNVIYQDGWNEVYLNFKDALKSENPIDLSHIGGFWLYSNQVPEGVEIKVRNVRFIEGSKEAICEHEKCATCGGCLVENCDCTIEGCCTPCTCPTITYETTYTFPIPANNNTSWVTGGRWCAATNGSKTWASASGVKDADGNLLTNAAEGVLSITAGQDAAGGTAKTTGLLFIASSDVGYNAGVTEENGRVTFDLYVYDVAAFKANGSTLQIADMNYNASRWINDGNRLTWDLTGMNLVQGWNTISLNLSDAVFTQTASTTKSTTFDPSVMMYLWVYTKNMPDGQQLAIRNVYFEEGSIVE